MLGKASIRLRRKLAEIGVSGKNPFVTLLLTQPFYLKY